MSDNTREEHLAVCITMLRLAVDDGLPAWPAVLRFLCRMIEHPATKAMVTPDLAARATFAAEDGPDAVRRWLAEFK